MDSPESPSCLPLFPLPERVLYPGQAVTVRVTTREHECVLRAARRLGGWLAVGTSAPEWWRSEASPRAEVYRAVCVAELERTSAGPPGETVTLRGRGRGWVHSIEHVCGVPSVLVEQFAETAIDLSPRHIDDRRFELLRRLPNVWPALQRNSTLWGALHQDLPLGRLCDLLAATLGLEPSSQLLLLGESDAVSRSELLLQQMQAQELRRRVGWSAITDPPSFSLC